MGRSHARAYAAIDGYELAGLCTRGIASRDDLGEFGDVPRYSDFATALAAVRPDVVSINTYPDTHASFAIAAIEAGADVFVEKPLAQTIAQAEAVVAAAVRTGRKVLVGYILRVHPAWTLFIERARMLGKPLVMRMNLNQQADGARWRGMQNLMRSLSPLVDCGVHYVDMMAVATGARPVHVHAIGARLSEAIAGHVHNYGQLQVTFDDGSVGWYEAGWGPMMSETAYSVKDIVGPRGAVSMVAGPAQGSADVSGHTSVSNIRVHHGGLDGQGRFERVDELLSPIADLGHDALCALEQQVLLDAIRHDGDLSVHLQQAVDSLRVVLAAEESIRTGQVVSLQDDRNHRD
jgi:predicted dehydrogenase